MFANGRVVALREAQDEIMRECRLSGGENLRFARAGPAHFNVFADRAREHEHVLTDIGDGVPE
jgi:hypothetical protein